MSSSLNRGLIYKMPLFSRRSSTISRCSSCMCAISCQARMPGSPSSGSGVSYSQNGHLVILVALRCRATRWIAQQVDSTKIDNALKLSLGHLDLHCPPDRRFGDTADHSAAQEETAVDGIVGQVGPD